MGNSTPPGPPLPLPAPARPAPRHAALGARYLLLPTGLVARAAREAAVSPRRVCIDVKGPLSLEAVLSVSGVLATQVAPYMTRPRAMGMGGMYGLVIILLVVTGLRR
ncbi:hypothetical protein [Streptomyces albidoflavus]|uniref:hypothetical protein n=1 Tax=Streptomyces albidoflavus TaxID=1886 RepID=UPI0035296EB4